MSGSAFYLRMCVCVCVCVEEIIAISEDDDDRNDDDEDHDEDATVNEVDNKEDVVNMLKLICVLLEQVIQKLETL